MYLNLGHGTLTPIDSENDNVLAKRYREVLSFTCSDMASIFSVDLYPVLAGDVHNAGLPRDGYVIRSALNLRELRDHGSLQPTGPVDAESHPHGNEQQDRPPSIQECGQHEKRVSCDV